MDNEAIQTLQPAQPAATAHGAVDAAVTRAVELLAEAGGTSGKGPLTILVNDPQRHTASEMVLGTLAEQAEFGPVRILVATGTHEISTAEKTEFEARLLRGPLSHLPVQQFAWHDCRSASLSRIGGPAGWLGHRWLTEDGPLLAVGSVEPHYFAGFTGAHKTATVGCGSYEDIESNHAAALDPKCRPCRLDGNPVYEALVGMLDAIERTRRVVAVNLVQVGPSVVAAAAGGPASSLRALVKPATDAFMRRIDAPADALIAHLAGPLGGSFYQADKGIKNNEWAVRDGGCLVLAAPCPKGIGQDHFLELLRQADSYDRAVEIVRRRGYRLGDHKAVRLRYLTDTSHRGVRVFIVSDGLTAEDAEVLGATKADSVEGALSAARIDPRKRRVYRILDAGNCCVLAGND